MGWRAHAPALSRKPWPWMVRAALIRELCARNRWLVGVFLLLMVVSYGRQDQIGNVVRSPFVRPMREVHSSWVHVMNPETLGRASKTEIFDDATPLEESALDFTSCRCSRNSYGTRDWLWKGGSGCHIGFCSKCKSRHAMAWSRTDHSWGRTKDSIDHN